MISFGPLRGSLWKQLWMCITLMAAMVLPNASFAQYGVTDGTGGCTAYATFQDAVNHPGALEVWVEGAQVETQETVVDKNLLIASTMDHTMCGLAAGGAGSIAAFGAHRVMYVDAPGPIFVTVGIPMSRGSVVGNGGTIYLGDAVTLNLVDEAVISGGRATGHGGCIYGTEATVRMAGDVVGVTNCRAGVDGGGIALDGSHPTNDEHNILQNINDNRAIAGDGGGVWLTDAAACVFDVQMNSAQGSGGAIYFSSIDPELRLYTVGALNNNDTLVGDGGAVFASGPNSNVHIGRSAIDNYAGGNGGALASTEGATMRLRGGIVFSDNEAGLHGGAVYAALNATVRGPDVTGLLPGCYQGSAGSVDVNQNVAGVDMGGAVINPSDGGGIYVDASEFSWDAGFPSTIAENRATNAGGGAAAVNAGQLRLPDFEIESNLADGANAGGLLVRDSGSLASVPEAIIHHNIAFTDGGGVAVVGGHVEGTNLTVHSNTAAEDGGGLFLENTSAALPNATVSSNISGKEGGGIWAHLGTSLDLDNATMSANSGDQGSALHIENGTLTLSDSTLQNNIDSAALVVDGGTATLTDCLLSSNGRTGARLMGNAAVSLAEVKLDDNGYRGLVVWDTASATFSQPSGCAFPCNSMQRNGREGIRQTGGTVVVRGAWIGENGGNTWHGVRVSGSGSSMTIENTILDLHERDAVHALGGTVNVTQATVVGNDKGLHYGGASGSVTNSIFRKNVVASDVDAGSTVSIDCLLDDFNMVQHPGGTIITSGLPLTGFPFFMDREGRDYRLTVNSGSVVDQCSTGVRPDMDGNSLQGAAYDAGAFEF